MNRRSTISILATIFVSVTLLIGANVQTFADSINNNANAIHLIQGGASINVGYYVQATGGDGCDAAADPVTIELDGVPADVTYSPTTLTFNSCNNEQEITFTALLTAATGGPFKVTVVVVDGDGVYNLSPGNLNIFVQAPEPVIEEEEDTTPPIVTGTPDREPDSNGWYNSPVTITWTADEPATCDDPTVYSGPDGAGIELIGQCTDEAGNVGTGSVTINYDATNPTITVGDSEYIIGEPYGPYAECDDETSGIATCDVPVIDTSSTSSGTVTVTAEDNAGNSDSTDVVYSVIYGCVDGSTFQNPVPNAQHKQGRTLPVKFETCDYYSNPVPATGATLYVDGNAATTKGGSNVGNLFRYDATGGINIYNLDTTGLSIGTHTLKADLGNGQTIETTFKIVK